MIDKQGFEDQNFALQNKKVGASGGSFSLTLIDDASFAPMSEARDVNARLGSP